MQNLTQLGMKIGIPSSPDEAVLEIIEPPGEEAVRINRAAIRMSCPEFTSLCPVTGQPDFAKLFIDYIPAGKLVESKSLKLFLSSFRSHGAFHEDCTTYIGARLQKVLSPRWLRISGIWYPRGGIPIDVYWQTGPFPPGYHLPRLRNFDYEGR